MFLNIYTIAGANNIYGAQDIYYIMLQLCQSYSNENIFIVYIARYKIVIKENTKTNYYNKQFILVNNEYKN